VFDFSAYKQLADENDRLRAELEKKEHEREECYEQVKQIQTILAEMTQIIAELKGDRVKPLL